MTVNKATYYITNHFSDIKHNEGCCYLLAETEARATVFRGTVADSSRCSVKQISRNFLIKTAHRVPQTVHSDTPNTACAQFPLFPARYGRCYLYANFQCHYFCFVYCISLHAPKSFLVNIHRHFNRNACSFSTNHMAAA